LLFELESLKPYSISNSLTSILFLTESYLDRLRDSPNLQHHNENLLRSSCSFKLLSILHTWVYILMSYAKQRIRKLCNVVWWTLLIKKENSKGESWPPRGTPESARKQFDFELKHLTHWYLLLRYAWIRYPGQEWLTQTRFLEDRNKSIVVHVIKIFVEVHIDNINLRKPELHQKYNW